MSSEKNMDNLTFKTLSSSVESNESTKNSMQLRRRASTSNVEPEVERSINIQQEGVEQPVAQTDCKNNAKHCKISKRRTRRRRTRRRGSKLNGQIGVITEGRACADKAFERGLALEINRRNRATIRRIHTELVCARAASIRMRTAEQCDRLRNISSHNIVASGSAHIINEAIRVAENAIQFAGAIGERAALLGRITADQVAPFIF